MPAMPATADATAIRSKGSGRKPCFLSFFQSIDLITRYIRIRSGVPSHDDHAVTGLESRHDRCSGTDMVRQPHADRLRAQTLVFSAIHRADPGAVGGLGFRVETIFLHHDLSRLEVLHP